MYTLKKFSETDYLEIAEKFDFPLTIEQTPEWGEYQATIPGRTPFGFYCVENDDKPVAIFSLVQFETHGYLYLRANHGPIYIDTPDEEDETAILQSIKNYLHNTYPKHVFFRCNTFYDNFATKALSGVGYDTTVFVDLSGDDEDIMQRMKSRGRRDVRKSLRECPCTTSEETELATANFVPYYDVMVDTGKRDGFSPAPMQDYQNMLKILGPDKCKLFCAREGDIIASWSIYTICTGVATRYYAASRTQYKKKSVNDKLAYEDFCRINKLGVKVCDLMGIGSEFAPSLKGLNEFKCKFSTDITQVSAMRDIPLRSGFYNCLKLAKKFKH